MNKHVTLNKAHLACFYWTINLSLELVRGTASRSRTGILSSPSYTEMKWHIDEAIVRHVFNSFVHVNSTWEKAKTRKVVTERASMHSFLPLAEVKHLVAWSWNPQIHTFLFSANMTAILHINNANIKPTEGILVVFGQSGLNAMPPH